MKHFIIHPWEFAADELQARGRSEAQLAKIIGKTRQEVNYFITWKRNMDTEWAMRIASAFGTDPELWMNLQSTYDLQKLQEDKTLWDSFSLIREKAKALTLA